MSFWTGHSNINIPELPVASRKCRLRDVRPSRRAPKSELQSWEKGKGLASTGGFAFLLLSNNSLIKTHKYFKASIHILLRILSREVGPSLSVRRAPSHVPAGQASACLCRNRADNWMYPLLRTHRCMAVIVQSSRVLLSRSPPSSSRTLMSVLTASAAPMQATTSAMASQSSNNNATAAALQKLEEEKNKVQLVMTLAERYGGRAIQRTASSESAEDLSAPTSSSSTSPPAFQPFSSTWAARYWQLQKLKAEQALAELEQRAREKDLLHEDATA